MHYLEGTPMSPLHLAAMRAYLVQWMAGDWQGPGIADLRDRAARLASRPEIDRWLLDAEVEGIDPL